MEAQADLLTMTDAQCAVLDYMTDDLGYPFRQVAADTGITEKHCRSITRGFHAMGMTGFGALFDQDEHKVVGRGYWLSEYGYNLRRQMQKMRHPTPLPKGTPNAE